MPEDLQGMTVLDIGASDGFFSFEAERRGAKRVLAIDLCSWENAGGKAGFDLARRVFNSRVEDMVMDVLEISPEKIGTFDLVLFLGVFYHLRHPLLALEKVFSVTKKQLILETHIAMLSVKQPVMRFYPDSELNNGPSNWYGPNIAAIESMLRDVGFQKIKIFSRQYSLFSRFRRVVGCKVRKEKRTISEVLHEDRVVFHAFR